MKGTIGDAVFTVPNGYGHNIRKMLTHLQTWLAWIIATLWTPEISLNREYLNADVS